MRKDRLIGGALIAALIILVAVGLWKTADTRQDDRIGVQQTYRGVMGTDCTLAAVVTGDSQRPLAEKALGEAADSLREVEARMSSWLDASEISRLNRSPAGVKVPLSPQTLDVLRSALDAYEQTGGAFDVTCRPLIELWREAGKRGTPPDEEQLRQARAQSNWDLIELQEDGAVKHADTARVDLGGIAKGYAIDAAVELMGRERFHGGLVNLGGDLRCFGKPPAGERWSVDIRNPNGAKLLAQLQLPGGAVCTSGNYERFNEIGGRRYSHIIDPRSGNPVDKIVSVTVVAPTAMTADIWATALSVLGPAGMDRLPDGVEAMMLDAAGSETRRHESPGFGGFIKNAGR